ncbi:MAG: glycosyltransferase family 9 protein, partial [Gammaproteobacteria bacterium]
MLSPPMILPGTPVERICVFRALQLGDMICAGPALRALHARFPAARVTLVGLPWAADFAGRMHDCVDDFVAFPGWPGLPERVVDLERLPGFLDEMQQRRFDLALQMHGNGRLTNPLVRAFAARHTIGYRPARSDHDGRHDSASWPYPEDLHEVHRNLRLVAHLGARGDDDRVAFPLMPADWAELRRLR